jgi:hypothetical protein
MLVLALSTSFDLELDKLRPRGGHGRAALQLPIGQPENGWFTGFVDLMLQLF